MSRRFSRRGACVAGFDFDDLDLSQDEDESMLATYDELLEKDRAEERLALRASSGPCEQPADFGVPQ